MDWKEFFADIIGSIAWPSVVIYLAWLLKDKLGELLPRLKKLRHKDTELEFTESVSELVLESRAEQHAIPASQLPKLKDNFDFLVKLAEISPRSSILESFRTVESAAFIAVAKAYPEISQYEAKNPMRVFDLLRGKILNDAQLKQLQELRRLRNMAAHTEDFNLHGMPIESYIDIALTMANELASYEP
tara:strand:+ start:187 stop:750 length:564 start_codon:yes stop_codon:yes gene_type:complete